MKSTKIKIIILSAMTMFSSITFANDDYFDASLLSKIPIESLDMDVHYNEEKQILSWVGFFDDLNMAKFRLVYEEKPIKKIIFRNGRW